MKEIPSDFWGQLIARFGQSQPKFYQIILKNSVIITGLAFALPYITTDILPGVGVDVPPWLTFLNGEFIKWRTILMGAGIGSALVAKTTLNTAGTPPLETKAEKPATDYDQVIAQLRTEMDELKAKQNNPTGL